MGFFEIPRGGTPHVGKALFPGVENGVYGVSGRVGGGLTRWHTDGTKKLQQNFFGPGEAGDEKNCKVNPVTFCFLGNFGRVTFHF